MDLALELQKIYDSELNLRIGWMWDGGINLLLGDEVNGFLAEENVASIGEIVPWFQEAIAHFFPDSTYGQSLPADVRERAAERLFRPPSAGAQVICPHCGAYNASIMDELLAFVCRRCGAPLKVEPPKVQ